MLCASVKLVNFTMTLPKKLSKKGSFLKKSLWSKRKDMKLAFGTRLVNMTKLLVIIFCTLNIKIFPD